jgi:hypothetical protein
MSTNAMTIIDRKQRKHTECRSSGLSASRQSDLFGPQLLCLDQNALIKGDDDANVR